MASHAPAPDSGARDRGAAINADLSAGPAEFISFEIDNDHHGIDIRSVREINEWSSVTHLPKQPEFVCPRRARSAWSGRAGHRPALPLWSGPDRVHADTHHHSPVGGRQAGLLADRVFDIVSFERSEVQRAPSLAHSSCARFLAGNVTVDGAMIALIDLVAMLSDDAYEGRLPAHFLDA